jgi:hypothetical protein
MKVFLLIVAVGVACAVAVSWRLEGVGIVLKNSLKFPKEQIPKAAVGTAAADTIEGAEVFDLNTAVQTNLQTSVQVVLNFFSWHFRWAFQTVDEKSGKFISLNPMDILFK